MFQLFSPAKLNLFLEVSGKRPDGFHELETVMVRSDFCDTIRFEQNAKTTIQLVLAPESSGFRPDNFPLNESNLIIQAANELRTLTGTSFGATISIVKRIPAEAGLAGGSSNAATTLLGLNQLWDLRLEKNHLHQIAAKLGSDINFFVEDCRAAVCRGRGEIVEPIDTDGEFHFVAFHPGVGNPTPAVFSKLVIAEAQQQKSSEAVQAALQQGDTQRLIQAIFNRLTDAARSINPDMDIMMADVEQRLNRPVFMSGSGATCFVMATNRREAKRLQSQIAADGRTVLGFFRI